MQPIGNKYLVKVNVPIEDKVGDILLPTGKTAEEIHYTGTIVEYGTYMTEKHLLPLNTNVIFNWKDKDSKIKISLNNELYYICNPNAILTTINEVYK